MMQSFVNSTRCLTRQCLIAYNQVLPQKQNLRTIFLTDSCNTETEVPTQGKGPASLSDQVSTRPIGRRSRRGPRRSVHRRQTARSLDGRDNLPTNALTSAVESLCCAPTPDEPKKEEEEDTIPWRDPMLTRARVVNQGVGRSINSV